MEPTPVVLDDRYELRSLLAVGGMGRVWRAHDRVLDRPVAVKVLRREYADDPVFLSRFRTEARLSAGLTHPNIAVLHDYGEAGPPGDRLVWLVMELVHGEALADVLAREGRLGADRTLDVVRQTAAGLAAAHAAGVVHRDVKPGNLLVRVDGTLKITDFGIAWSATSQHVTRTGHVVGTAQYLSPEQARGAQATPASDVYALGAVAYECLSGRRVFDGPDAVEVAAAHIRQEPDPLPDDVPAPLRRLVEAMLVKDPQQRYPDGAAVLAAVDGLGAADAGPGDPGRTATRVLPLPGPAVTREMPVVPPDAAPAGPSGAGAGPGDTSVPLPTGPPAERPRRGRHAVGAGNDDDRPRRRRRLLAPAAALLALAAAGAGVVIGTQGGSAPAGEPSTVPTATAPATTPSAPPTPGVPMVRLVAEEHVGRPVAQVRAELTGLDLLVQLRAVETTDVPAGRVTAIEPTGQVPVGTTVTVTHAVAPPPPPARTTSPAPEPEGEPAPDDGDDDGDGEWSDGGDGNEEHPGRGRGRGRD